MLLATAPTEHVRAYVHATAWLILNTHEKKQAGNLLTCHQPLAMLLEQPEAHRVLPLKLGQQTIDTLVALLRYHRDVLIRFEEQFQLSPDTFTSIKYPTNTNDVSLNVDGLAAFLAQNINQALFNDFLLALFAEQVLPASVKTLSETINMKRTDFRQ